MTETDTLLTPQQAADLANVKTSTIKTWGRSGKLARVMLGARCVRFRKSDLLGFIATHVEPASTAQK